MRVIFASDHAGFDLKGKLFAFVKSLGYEVADLGPYAYNAEDDYPDFIGKAARAVSEEPKDTVAVVLGGSGQGEAMTANRFSRVRAAVYYGGNDRLLTLSREHNDANVLSLGARFLSEEDARRAVEVWLHARFSGAERHVRRIKKIDTETR